LRIKKKSEDAGVNRKGGSCTPRAREAACETVLRPKKEKNEVLYLRATGQNVRSWKSSVKLAASGRIGKK